MAKNARDSVYFNRETNQFSGIDSQIHKELQEAYKGVDVDQEIKKMGLWLTAKGKSRKGTIGFIINWLNNAKPSYAQQFDVPESSPLADLVHGYLLELWKDKEYLIELNTLRMKH